MKGEVNEFGFTWGPAAVTRVACDNDNGWVVIGLLTEKYKNEFGIQIYVTKTGKVRIMDRHGEWRKPRSTQATRKKNERTRKTT